LKYSHRVSYVIQNFINLQFHLKNTSISRQLNDKVNDGAKFVKIKQKRTKRDRKLNIKDAGQIVLYYTSQVGFRYPMLIYVTYKEVCHPIEDKETIKEQQRLNVFGLNNLVEADKHRKYHYVNDKHHKSEVILDHIPIIILAYNESGFLYNTI
jgi:hypothetical protein